MIGVLIYALPVLIIASATVPPLFAVTIPLTLALLAHGPLRARQRRAAERVVLEHRRARLEARRRRELIAAWKSFS